MNVQMHTDRSLNVGDLVCDLPFGREWFQNNPWLIGSDIGIVIQRLSFSTVLVYFAANNKISKSHVSQLEVVG